MGKVILNMSMSLDGFIAGPNIRTGEPMGDGGEKLHEWMFNKGNTNENPEEHQADFFKNTGAYIMGQRTFELGLEPWGENPPFHAPCFVLSDEPRETITKTGSTSYVFVTNGPDSTLEQAKDAAGSKDVIIMGGANAAQQYVNSGLLDEIRLHLVHTFLGNGTRLFDKLTIKQTDLEKLTLADAQGVTHFKFRIRK